MIVERRQVTVGRPNVTVGRQKVTSKRGQVTVERPQVTVKRQQVTAEEQQTTFEQQQVNGVEPGIALEASQISFDELRTIFRSIIHQNTQSLTRSQTLS